MPVWRPFHRHIRQPGGHFDTATTDLVRFWHVAARFGDEPAGSVRSANCRFSDTPKPARPACSNPADDSDRSAAELLPFTTQHMDNNQPTTPCWCRSEANRSWT